MIWHDESLLGWVFIITGFLGPVGNANHCLLIAGVQRVRSEAIQANSYVFGIHLWDMALPEQFEQGGILIGSIFLVGLPVSALVTGVYGFTIQSWTVVLVWFLPGLVVGIPLAKGWLPVTYHQVWVVTVSGWLFTFAGWVVFGLSLPASDTVLAVAIWILAILLGGLIAWIRPLSILKTRLQQV